MCCCWQCSVPIHTSTKPETVTQQNNPLSWETASRLQLVQVMNLTLFLALDQMRADPFFPLIFGLSWRGINPPSPIPPAYPLTAWGMLPPSPSSLDCDYPFPALLPGLLFNNFHGCRGPTQPSPYKSFISLFSIDNLWKRRGEHSVSAWEHCVTAAPPPSRIRSDKQESARQNVVCVESVWKWHTHR